MQKEKYAITETDEYRKTVHFYVKLIYMLRGLIDCDAIFRGSSEATDAIAEWNNCVSSDSAYSKIFGEKVVEWLKSRLDIGEKKSINGRFVSFAGNTFEIDYDFLLMNSSDDEVNETIYKIMCRIVSSWFAVIEEITGVRNEIDVYSDLMIREELMLGLQRVLEVNKTYLSKLSGKSLISWRKYMRRFSLGAVTVETKECDEDIRSYFNKFIVLGSKSVEACSETTYLAYHGNLVARYEMGNKCLYEGKYDEAWRWWNNEIGINGTQNENGFPKYSSSIISLADLLDRHDKLEEMNFEAINRLEKVKTYDDVYKLQKEGNENAFRRKIMQMLLEASATGNEIALNMIGKQLKRFPEIFKIENAVGTDYLLNKVDACRKEHPFSWAGYEHLDYMGLFEASSDLDYAFAKNNIYDAIARDKVFESAAEEVKKYGVEKLFESAHLGNYYALTKVVPLLLGETLCPRLAEVKINDIPGYEESAYDECVREAVDNLVISIAEAPNSHYYMPHYYMAKYFSSEGEYHNQAAQYLERLGIDDNTMVTYLDDAIPQFNEANAGAKVIKEHMIAIRGKLCK